MAHNTAANRSLANLINNWLTWQAGRVYRPNLPARF